MIDFHCHLDLQSDPTAVLNEVERLSMYVLAVTTTPKAWTGAKKLIGERKRVQLALGLHPELVPERHTEVPLLEYLLPETKYIGEVGIEGGPHMKGSYKLQEDIFARILKASSRNGGRILSIHSRRAASGVLDAICGEVGCGVPILHWFSGSQRELDRAIQIGCWFSVGPAMLQSTKGRKLIEGMPKERVLTETDSPFSRLGEMPMMPWDVRLLYPALSEIWRCEVESVEHSIQQNLKILLHYS